MRTILLLLFAALPALAFPNGYSYCKLVTTLHGMVSGTSDLTNYPLTLVVTDADLKTVGNGGLVNNSSGYDIGIGPDCTGSGSMLTWDLASYTPTTGAVEIHVLRPTLSHTADDTVGLYYGGSFSSYQSTASSVWASYYKQVLHLTTPSSPTDSTTNANNGTNAGATAVAGQIGGAAAFNGSSQYIIRPDTASMHPAGAFAVELWLKRGDFGNANEEHFFSAFASSSGNLFGILFNFLNGANVDQLRFFVGDGTGSYEPFLTAATFTNTNWHHIVAIYNPNNLSVFVDGVAATRDSSFAGTANAPNWTGTVSRLGDANTGSEGLYFNGALDEIRFWSGTIPTSDWILTTYRNQSAPATYISLGPRLPASGGSTVRRRVIQGGM